MNMMRFNPKMKVRRVSGEDIVMRTGGGETDLTTVIGLNESTMLLYRHFGDRPFSTDDAVRALTEQYEIDEATARRDVEQWAQEMRQQGLLLDA